MQTVADVLKHGFEAAEAAVETANNSKAAVQECVDVAVQSEGAPGITPSLALPAAVPAAGNTHNARICLCLMHNIARFRTPIMQIR
jgi:hypothetical protein